jgi:hypothetical protein
VDPSKIFNVSSPSLPILVTKSLSFSPNAEEGEFGVPEEGEFGVPGEGECGWRGRRIPEEGECEFGVVEEGEFGVPESESRVSEEVPVWSHITSGKLSS